MLFSSGWVVGLIVSIVLLISFLQLMTHVNALTVDDNYEMSQTRLLFRQYGCANNVDILNPSHH